MVYLKEKYLYLDISTILASIILCIFYLMEYIIPLEIPLFILSLYLIISILSARFFLNNFLAKIMILFYFLPILPIYGYIFYENYDWTWRQHQKILLTPLINFKISILGTVGILGLYLGMSLSQSKFFKKKNFIFPNRNKLSKILFIFWTLLSLFLSYLSARPNTIFEAAYFAGGFSKFFYIPNFNAGYLISYIIACFLYMDYRRDYGFNKIFKKYIWYFSMFVIIFYFQIIRGDREFIGLLIGIYLIKIYEPLRNGVNETQAFKKIKLDIRRYFFIALFFVFILLYIGIVRFSAFDGNFLVTNLLSHAPWTMTTLSFLAYLSSEISKSFTFGMTYFDYFLSIIPTYFYFIFDIESPSWSNDLAAKLVNTNVTSGGVHLSLISLSNFGIFGVFIFMFLYSYFACWLEKKANYFGSIYFLIWIGLSVAVPFWFWYGEMTAIRAIMAAVIIYYLLKIKL